MSSRFSYTNFQLQSNSSTSLYPSAQSSWRSMPNFSSKKEMKFSSGSTLGLKLTNTYPAQVSILSCFSRQFFMSNPSPARLTVQAIGWSRGG
jgi:hypothetical protein